MELTDRQILEKIWEHVSAAPVYQIKCPKCIVPGGRLMHLPTLENDRSLFVCECGITFEVKYKIIG